MAGGGFEKNTEYSFGYIARVKGTDFFKEDKSSSKVKRGLEDKKQEDPEGQLFLVEKVGSRTIIGDSANKEQKGLTPKKFLLVGSNKDSREIEVTGLVSLVQFGHNGINTKCSKKEEAGAILDGSCDKVFFKSYGEENPPSFIKKRLVKEDSNSSASIMQLTPKGKSLGVVWGQKKEATNGNENKWSRTGYLYLSGKEGAGEVVRKVWTDIEKSKNVKGFFVVHDLIFSKNGMGGEWTKEQERWGTILVKGVKKREELTGNNKQKDIRALKGQSVGEKVIDIPLSSNRNYYIWDPSKTQIKNGEFVTDDGIKLPFKLSVNTTWNSLLVK
ncbi:hypothetical protein WEN_01375 [Mycoplasma wenyonii str. Massachusetts]|uniref:Uncharacterized protein n=1 Tax=Mycoplasma wenyonii (strain Massachusetts) TaxID=1197325 RepID=I6ZEP8_MYCWM|nr:hypothetical protein [Mycoplasma wenyonii]AFN65072.1 hypothetical protein WEN_01375 [Mycoplasma wenyonii str. Massachusetts]